MVSYSTRIIDLNFNKNTNLEIFKQEFGAANIQIVKTQRNSTQLKTTLKQLVELDTVVTCSTHPTDTQ